MAPADFEEKVSAALSRRVPGFRRIESLRRLSGGASQETYRIVLALSESEAPRTVALRRATAGVEAPIFPGPGLEVEARLMEAAGRAGVPSPRVVCVLDPEDGLGPAFLMDWVDGETLGAKIARSPELESVRAGLALECGRILARIHAIDVDAEGLRPRLRTLTTEAYVRTTWERLRELPTSQPMIDYTARWLLDHLPPTSEPRLVHNDFRNGNFIVGPEGIRAVLDWELAYLGDPMRDLGWLCTSSWRFGVDELEVGGFGTRDDLVRGYESVSGTPVDLGRVRFWEVFGSFWWATACAYMAQLHRTGQDRSVERAAIGRRSSEAQIDCVNLLVPGPVTLVEADQEGADDALPTVDELLESVHDHLAGPVIEASKGRAAFLARVAAGTVDVVRRELRLGARRRSLDLERLRALYESRDDERSLRARLCRELRDGTMPIDPSTPAGQRLTAYLRDSVANRVAIDQPRYAGLLRCLAHDARRGR